MKWRQVALLSFDLKEDAVGINARGSVGAQWNKVVCVVQLKLEGSVLLFCCLWCSLVGAVVQHSSALAQRPCSNWCNHVTGNYQVVAPGSESSKKAQGAKGKEKHRWLMKLESSWLPSPCARDELRDGRFQELLSGGRTRRLELKALICYLFSAPWLQVLPLGVC